MPPSRSSGSRSPSSAPTASGSRGARGGPPPPSYKVSATYRDGYRAQGLLTIFGRDAVAKARRCGVDRPRPRPRRRLRPPRGDRRVPRRRRRGPRHGGRSIGRHLMEVVLRVAVADPSREAVERFSRELMPLVTAGPPGTTGYAEGRPKVHPVFRYWPCLIDRGSGRAGGPPDRVNVRSKRASTEESTLDERRKHGHAVRLGDLADARSGDKGINANVGVIARSEAGYELLREHLTADRVAAFFARDGADGRRPLRAAEPAGAELHRQGNPPARDAGRCPGQGARPGDPGAADRAAGRATDVDEGACHERADPPRRTGRARASSR